MSQVRVVGLRQTIKALKEIGVPKEEIADASQEAASIVEVVAHTLVPKRTGLLDSTIRTGRQQQKAVIRAGNARVPYAGPIHWGWQARNIKPNPFFVKAIKGNEQEILDTYIDALKDVIAKYS